MIELYIGNKRVDITDDSLIQMNYIREELGNPATIRNEYSQQVTLPSTAQNNLIFDEFFRLDRMTRATGFNALQRTPFSIYNETGDILVSGYCKLDKVQYKGEQVYSYSVSLYGALGGYFYDLSYLPDGNAMTLGDLTYQTSEGVDWKPNDETIALKANNILQVWDAITTQSMFGDDPWYNILNFAPAYNGIPQDFDAKKALVTGGFYKDIVSKGDDDKPHPSSGNAYLVTMASDKTADEVRDYRAYLQRPVLSITAFIDALVNRGGFFATAEARARLDDGLWVTLPLPARAVDYDNYSLRGIFSKSMTPADLLISLAKCFGLVFLTEQDTIVLMTREEFYAGGSRIDLESRVNKPSIASKPNGIDAKWYIFKDEVKGAFADSYNERYGRDYAGQKVNTGWEFDSSSKVVTSHKTRGAAQVLMQSRAFVSLYNALGTYFPTIPFESVSFQGFNSAGTESKTVSLPIDNPVYANSIWYNDEFQYYDITDKPQFCDKDGKPIDGDGVLLHYNGYKTMPTDSKCWWRLSNDDQTLYDLLNEGKPCYELRQYEGVLIPSMPLFSRWSDTNLDWGIPAEIGIPAVAVPADTLYERFWKRHITEIYDKDALVVSAQVNLRGMQVSQSLLRNEYWFDGSLWRLNKIVNHSLTTQGLTECEFIRIVDIDEQGRDSISLAITEISVTEEEQTASAFVKATAGWKVLSSPTWCSAFSQQRGDASLSYTEVTFTVAENEGETRTGRIVFVLEDGTAQAYLRVTQEGSGTPIPTGNIAVFKSGSTDNFETVSASAGSIAPEIVSTDAWTATTQDSWLWSDSARTSHNWSGTAASVRTPIAVYFSANTGATRQGSITFTNTDTGETCIYIITQEAGSSPSPTGYARGYAHNTSDNYVTLLASDDYTIMDVNASGAWTATTSANWIWSNASRTSHNWSGNAGTRIENWITVDENTGATRRGVITLTHTATGNTATFEITQQGSGVSPSFYLLPSGTLNVEANKTSVNIEVVSNTSWRLTAGSGVLIDGVAVKTGTGNAYLTMTFSANTSPSPKSNTLSATTTDGSSITDSLSVVQEGVEAKYFFLSPHGTRNVEASSTGITVQVTSNTSWRIDCGTGVKIDGSSSKTGTGNATLAMTFSANEGDTPKSNTLSARTTSGTTITDSLEVIQSAVTPEPPRQTFLTLSEQSLSFPIGGGDTTIVLTSSEDWSIEGTIPSWITVSPSSGTATNGVLLNIHIAFAMSERSETLYFVNDDGEEQELEIYQGYNPMSVSPSSLNLSASEQTQSVELTCTLDWSVDESQLPSWMSVSPMSGTGDETLLVSVDENTGELPRSGMVKVNGQGEFASVSVTQAAGRQELSIAWQEESPQTMGQGETLVLHIVTNARTYTIDKLGSIDGKWTVSKSGKTVTVTKLTADIEDLNITASAGGEVTATMVIQSRSADVRLTAGAWRDTASTSIRGSYTIRNTGEESASITTPLSIEFLDTYGNALYQTSVNLPTTIAAGATVSNMLFIASAAIVSRYGLQNAVDVRMSFTAGGRRLSATVMIEASQPPMLNE